MTLKIIFFQYSLPQSRYYLSTQIEVLWGFGITFFSQTDKIRWHYCSTHVQHAPSSQRHRRQTLQTPLHTSQNGTNTAAFPFSLNIGPNHPLAAHRNSGMTHSINTRANKSERKCPLQSSQIYKFISHHYIKYLKRKKPT